MRVSASRSPGLGAPRPGPAERVHASTWSSWAAPLPPSLERGCAERHWPTTGWPTSGTATCASRTPRPPSGSRRSCWRRAGSDSARCSWSRGRDAPVTDPDPRARPISEAELDAPDAGRLRADRLRRPTPHPAWPRCWSAPRVRCASGTPALRFGAGEDGRPAVDVHAVPGPEEPDGHRMAMVETGGHAARSPRARSGQRPWSWPPSAPLASGAPTWSWSPPTPMTGPSCIYANLGFDARGRAHQFPAPPALTTALAHFLTLALMAKAAVAPDVKDSILDTIGAHAAGPALAHRRRAAPAGRRQARGLQPGRLDQGSDRRRADRGRRARRAAAPRGHDRRAHLGQHRHRAGHRRAAQGLPRDRGHAGQDVAREDRPAARLRGRGRRGARPMWPPTHPRPTTGSPTG